MKVVKEDSYGRKKRKDGKFKFSLKDLIQQYKQYAPRRYKKEYTYDDGAIIEVDDDGNKERKFFYDLDPETQKEMIERGEISVKDIRGGAKREGGGGKTVVKVLKGHSLDPTRIVYKGTKEGGTKVKTRYGKINPFKTLKKAIQTLRETGYVQPKL